MINCQSNALMLPGISAILDISTPQQTLRFEQLFGVRSDWYHNLQYVAQSSPDGMAQAFIMCKYFIGNAPSALLLGDEIFSGYDLYFLLEKATMCDQGTAIFAYHVQDPALYGVMAFDVQGCATCLEESFANPKTLKTVAGDNQVVDIAANLKPSSRGELEIADLNRIFLERDQLNVKIMGKGCAWFDAAHENLIETSNFIQTIERRKGVKVGCSEELIDRKCVVNAEQAEKLTKPLAKNGYGQYLISVPKDMALQ